MTDSYHGDISADDERVFHAYEPQEFPFCEQCGKTVTDEMDASYAPFCSRLCRNRAQDIIFDCCHKHTQRLIVREATTKLMIATAYLCRKCVDSINSNPADPRHVDGWKAGDPEDGPYCPECGVYGHAFGCARAELEEKRDEQINKTQLEALVDKLTLTGVVDLLSEIASEKSEHIQSNWQDTHLAQAWNRASNQLMLAAGKLPFDV
jgi:hypothetical protein